MTERRIRILSGIISLTLIVSLVYFGVKVRAVGVLKPKYQVNALFTSAGQGLQPQSDVKEHGVNIGHVRNVHLRKGKAFVRLDIDKGERIPVGATAIIRPKTLFGEKFIDIDPGPTETTGPFLHDEDSIKNTIGGFELERILTELYPILKAVKPSELGTVVGNLAQGGQGLGQQINRQIGNFATLADVQARHDADFRQFLDDLALLSDELANKAGDLVTTAQNLNVALPPLNARGDELAQILDQTARLSTDLADVLDANQSFLAKAATEGSKPLQILYDKRAEIIPLVDGLKTFFQVLNEVGHIDRGDGTELAAVKFIIGEQCAGARVNCGPNAGSTNTTTTVPTAASKAPSPVKVPPLPVPQAPNLTGPLLTPLPAPESGAAGITSLIGGLIG